VDGRADGKGGRFALPVVMGLQCPSAAVPPHHMSARWLHSAGLLA